MRGDRCGVEDATQTEPAVNGTEFDRGSSYARCIYPTHFTLASTESHII